MSMVEGVQHQFISLNIATALLLYAESGNLGHVLQAPCDVVLSREYIIQPDILFIGKGRRGLIGKTRLWGAPDIVIEILSEETREKDLRAKRNLYSRFGVKEYWVVDPKHKTVEVLVWSELGYATAGVFHKSQRLYSHALPKFRFPLSQVFAMGF